MFNNIDELFNKINTLWTTNQFSENKLKIIIPIWQKKLSKYSEDIVAKALEELASTSRYKPTLADFVEVCEKFKKEMDKKFTIDISKKDVISKSQFRSMIFDRYGEQAAHKVDLAYGEYERAKKNGTEEKYIMSIFERIRHLHIRKFKYYSKLKITDSSKEDNTIVWL